MLQRAIIVRDLSYYHVRFIRPQLNKSLIHAREVASVAAVDLNLQTFEREFAISALNSNKFCIWVSLTMLAAAQIITVVPWVCFYCFQYFLVMMSLCRILRSYIGYTVFGDIGVFPS
jgi:hypothetical protein